MGTYIDIYELSILKSEKDGVQIFNEFFQNFHDLENVLIDMGITLDRWEKPTGEFVEFNKQNLFAVIYKRNVNLNGVDITIKVSEDYLCLSKEASIINKRLRGELNE